MVVRVLTGNGTGARNGLRRIPVLELVVVVHRETVDRNGGPGAHGIILNFTRGKNDKH
jgi:hypothetical protein